ncbi:hypothetical protein [Streptomyces sanyensis]
MAIGVEGRIRAWASTREWSTWYAQGIVTGVGATREQAELADVHGDGRGGYYWVADGGAVPGFRRADVRVPPRGSGIDPVADRVRP